MSLHRARITGTGYAVPESIRLNDDPIFDWLHAHSPAGTNLFQGYVQRRVLAPGQDLVTTVAVPAAQAALASAHAGLGDIDLLLGTISVSDYDPPNALSQLHAALGLSSGCYVIPLANDFSNFNAGLLLAEAMIRAGRSRKALVVVGTNWSRYVDYRTPQAISAADGAGAAVVSATGKGWRIVDQEVLSATQNYGTMTMQSSAVSLSPPVKGYTQLFTAPAFQITAAGAAAFKTFGVEASPQAVLRLLARHRLDGSDISLVSHQASSVLIDAWNTTIKPGQYLQTLEQYANMTSANIPVTLAWAKTNGGIRRDHLVLFALGPDMHAHALLLARESS